MPEEVQKGTRPYVGPWLRYRNQTFDKRDGRLLEKGRNMTLVAMALRYERGPAPDFALHCSGVAAVCDKLLSNDASSVSLPYGKISQLGKSYLMGYAGDPSLVIRLGQKLQELLEGAAYESFGGSLATRLHRRLGYYDAPRS